MPDFSDSYAYLNERSYVPISGGEHEYTRWGFKGLLDLDACDLYQPDPAWSGGISEVAKILDLVSAYDKQAAIHNSIPSLGIHMSCAQPANLVPFAEYLMLVGDASQYFFKHKCRPENGYFAVPEQPGIGIEFDESKIVCEEVE